MKTLILNLFIWGFTGSEINAMQLCEGLRSLNIEADIGTLFLDSPMREWITSKGIKVMNLLEDDTNILDYDLIWAHHAPVLSYLLFKKTLRDTRIIFSSLGTLLPVEAPPLFHKDIHYILSLSPANKAMMVACGVPEERIHYFPIFAPEKYYLKARTDYALTPRKIVVISNHVPSEVREFAELAKQNQVQVNFIGHSDQPIFVDEEILCHYDLVITIGKTIQYCFALKIPAYCYDHFGGPGFIDQDNYEFTRVNNFSGRLSEIKRDANGLFSDIFAHYQRNLENLDFLYAESQQHFCLESNIKKVIQDIPKIPITNIQQFREKNLLAEKAYDLYLEQRLENSALRKAIWIKNQALENTILARESGHPRKMGSSMLAIIDRLSKRVKKHIFIFSNTLHRVFNSQRNEHYLSLIRSSDLFDEAWYLTRYPDVALRKMDPGWHYLYDGGFAGHDPGPKFSSQGYLDAYPDVRDAHMNPLIHYLQYGQKENRSLVGTGIMPELPDTNPLSS